MRLDTFLRRLAVLGAAALLAGYMRQELYGLVSNGRPTRWSRCCGAPASTPARSTATRPTSRSRRRRPTSAARSTLHANGYPRGNFDSVGQVFKEGFVSSPVEERARLTYALSQELANTLQTIDGVVVARVHPRCPTRNPLTDRPHPASASVFIKHRAGSDLPGRSIQMNGAGGQRCRSATAARQRHRRAVPAGQYAWQRAWCWPPSLLSACTAAARLRAASLLGGRAGVWGWRRRRVTRGDALVLVHGSPGRHRCVAQLTPRSCCGP